MIAELRPGRPDPLGATFDGEGVNFAVYSADATAIELCLFDAAGTERRTVLPEHTHRVWHGYAPGLAPGQEYGFRAHGAYDPAKGLRFNARKLLVDPYARALVGKVDYAKPVWGHAASRGLPAKGDRLARDEQDSASGMPRCLVVDDRFDWGEDHPPRVSWRDTVLYEVHVKGFTRSMPTVAEGLRGTYLGLASEAAISHLRALGVTGVELLPVHEACDEVPVATRGMTNYWGYSTLAFFAPDQRFASTPGAQVTEFKTMVRALHAAGIEVLLDVVYNHTAEGDHLGPTLSFRGLDNRTYYMLDADDPRRYVDTTGCGNALSTRRPAALRLIMDSLRYWVTEMHVDGFRFDLAPTLARDPGAFDANAAFLRAVHQDPVLGRVKLIAEPWDLGPGGYRVGQFPPPWAEWNGKFRDAVRSFWLGHANVLGELGYRLTGSSDLFQRNGRRPASSVNFVTSHDGFTLRDLTSYLKKHNLANGEDNRDGWDDNASDNFGVEGDTTDPAVLTARARQQRNLLTMLLLAQGVPMLASGDEIGKTQRGNNNAYCQDNEVSWLDWDLDAEKAELLAFVQRLIALRRAHAVFRRKDFLSGAPVRGSRTKDVTWFRSDGQEMSERDWQAPTLAFLALLLAGDALQDSDDACERGCDDSFLLLFSAHGHPLNAKLPGEAWGETWETVIDTGRVAVGDPREAERVVEEAPLRHAGERLCMAPRSTLVLKRIAPASGSWRPPPPKM